MRERKKQIRLATPCHWFSKVCPTFPPIYSEWLLVSSALYLPRQHPALVFGGSPRSCYPYCLTLVWFPPYPYSTAGQQHMATDTFSLATLSFPKHLLSSYGNAPSRFSSSCFSSCFTRTPLHRPSHEILKSVKPPSTTFLFSPVPKASVTP